MRRVAHLVESFLPLTQTFVYNQIAPLAADEGVVLTERLENLDAFRPRVAIVNILRSRPARLLAPRLRVPLARRAGLPDILPFSPRRVAREVRRRGVAVLHAHFGHVGYAALPAKRRAGVPLVTSFYGFDASLLAREPTWRRGFEALFGQGELFVAEGAAMRERLVALSCPREKVRVIPIGVDLSRYSYRERRRESRPVRLLFIGRFVEKKGLEYALRAFAGLRGRGIDAEFDVIGDGPLRERMERITVEQGVEDRVRFRGLLDHGTMVAALETADLLVQPSVTAADGDSEGGAPTVLLEAQAVGLPVLATRHADIPNVTLPGESAILCDEGDQDQLTAALVELASSPERWPALGRRGREFVASRHDIQKVMELLRSAYESL